MKELIRESLRRQKKQAKEYHLFKTILVFVKDPINESISMDGIIASLEQRVPQRLFRNVEVIYVGQFEELIEREVSAVFLDGAIYLDNNQTSEEDFTTDIVHELGHSFEGVEGEFIYADGVLKREFLEKRMQLLHVLEREGYKIKDKRPFANTEYDEEFDLFLYQEIGYPVLSGLTASFVVSPYGLTSLSEYWANGMENYLSGNSREVKTVSPKLYARIGDLVDNER